jgi:NAD(P)-dependent dehydrogenase (short-subunit alcohol dehydrogenase family)
MPSEPLTGDRGPAVPRTAPFQVPKLLGHAGIDSGILAAMPRTEPSQAPSLASGVAGRGVLITGAGGAIGGAVAAAFAAAGARLALTDVDAGSLERTAATLDAEAHLLPANLRDAEGRGALLEAAAARLGRIDTLVHTAAVIVRSADLAAVTEADWDLQEQVNLRATFFLARDVAEGMTADGEGGRIVLMTSQAWWTGGLEGSTVYAATKGGVVSLTRGLSRNYAPRGVRVNCVAPGAVDTPMLRDGSDPAKLEQLRASIPLGRFAEPAELASVILFLASDHARYMTGATLNVTGGQLDY